MNEDNIKELLKSCIIDKNIPERIKDVFIKNNLLVDLSAGYKRFFDLSVDGEEYLNNTLKIEFEDNDEDILLEYLVTNKILSNQKERDELKDKWNALNKFTNYLDMAEEFLKIQPLFYDKNKIWWGWDFSLNCWDIIDEVDIMNKIDSNISSSETTKAQIKQEILESLKRKSRLNAPKEMKENWIQFWDKIIDIETQEEIKVSSDYFSVNRISWKIGESEDTPIMDKIITEWVGEKYLKTMYEIIAFSLSNSYFIHRIFCFTGSGSNGKSKFMNLLKIFIGEKNTTSVSLDSLISNRFKTSSLFKKLVCFMGETNFNNIKKTDTLKSLTGQDPIDMEFKNKDSFTSLNYAKIIISSNSLPITEDKTSGFYRRWFIIDFPNRFTEAKDILKDIPEYEYENLAKKSIRILSELYKKREFTNEGSIEDRKKRYEEKSNPIQLFIKERCSTDPNTEVPFWEFYDILKGFLEDRGYRTLSKREVSNALKSDGFETKRMHKDREDGTPSLVHCIIGLSLKQEISIENDNSLLEYQRGVKVEINE